jgi:uncharacterized protein (UPF0303 family)
LEKAQLETLLAQLKEEEESLQFDTFNKSMAVDLGLFMVQEARAQQKPMVIDIMMNGQQLFHCALPGTEVDHDHWIQRKVKMVHRFGHSSYYMGTVFKIHNTTLEDAVFLERSEYAPYGGGFPLVLRNCGMIGSVCTSGMTEVEDHEFLIACLRKFLQK